MDIRFPNKEEIAELFRDTQNRQLPAEMDFIAMMAMGIQGLRIAIEEFPLDKYKSMEELLGYHPDYPLDPIILQEKKVPSVSLTCDEEGLPLLHLRVFTKDGDWLAEATCDLMNATGYFAGHAHTIVRELMKSGTVVTDEDFEIFIIRKTANMLKDAFAKLKDRIEITVQSFLQEISWNYLELFYEHHARFNSLQGLAMKRLHFEKHKEALLRKHEDDIRAIYADDSSETLFDLRKELLALTYEKTLEHWKEIERMQVEGKNWRRYVRAGDMSDITNDLIEDFEKGTDISGLALEHAARRAELHNIFCIKEKTLQKRKLGIMASGYSRSRLFQLKMEGKKLVEKRENCSQSSPS